MTKKFTFKDFETKFPNEDACLDYLFKLFYSNLPDFNKYYKVTSRKCYAHAETGKQISPTANTIFHKSSTPLKTWFFVIYLFSCSRNGISSYEIERQTGVTHKTAWRMGKQVRQLFEDNKDIFSSVVEADETYVGGQGGNNMRGRGAENKTPVIGLLERKSRVYAKVTANTRRSTIMPLIREHVKIGSEIMTDEYLPYASLAKEGYKHETIAHGAKEYVRGNVHVNTLEGFWSQMKRSIDGTHHFVSPKYLQNYVNEFTWKYNRSKLGSNLFEIILGGITKSVLLSPAH